MTIKQTLATLVPQLVIAARTYAPTADQRAEIGALLDAAQPAIAAANPALAARIYANRARLVAIVFHAARKHQIHAHAHEDFAAVMASIAAGATPEDAITQVLADDAPAVIADVNAEAPP